MSEGFSHILLPVDSSDRCLAAGRVARRLACEGQAQITFIFVVDTELVAELALIEKKPLEEVRRQVENMGWRYLNYCAHEAHQEGVTSHKILCHGSPAAEILDEARRRGVDLIVMAKSTERGPRRVALGRTLQRVIERAECPVVVVKYHPEEERPILI